MEKTEKIIRKGVVLGVGKPYNFVPTGKTEAVMGCKVCYAVGTMEDLSKPTYDEHTDILGFYTQEVNMPPEFYDVAKPHGVPCNCELVFELVVKTSGIEPVLTSINLLKPNNAK